MSTPPKSAMSKRKSFDRISSREIGTSSYCDSWWRNINDGDGSLMSSKEGKEFIGNVERSGTRERRTRLEKGGRGGGEIPALRSSVSISSRFLYSGRGTSKVKCQPTR